MCHWSTQFWEKIIQLRRRLYILLNVLRIVVVVVEEDDKDGLSIHALCKQRPGCKNQKATDANEWQGGI